MTTWNSSSGPRWTGNASCWRTRLSKPGSRRQTSASATHRGKAFFYLALTLGYMGGLYWLSSIPGEVDPESPLLAGIIAWTPPALQNLLHVPLFGILAMLWLRTLRLSSVPLSISVIWALLVTVGYGVMDELHQLYVPGRYASLTDMTLNGLGAVLGLWLSQRWHRRSVNRM